ncbi:Putative neutral zinc metallopeptidase [Polystyrenella longa]|uniref:Neutral zinc metallopeptidase n=1 Tax=Polystyrenella longa TaxID=2528007 RepID=A0A518CIG6_9PLAN|nr:zinc metallopeptidase [Polystyrenella longa]QDU79025.1 Putative neutral zinc metallopeptidase [Polystyrenella longa]
MMFFDPLYFVFLIPAFLLMLWAQMRVKSAYAKGMKVPARLTGAAAARYILDREGLQSVGIEETEGTLSDHYDPRSKVLRLSREVYQGNSAAAVGIAAHEAGHALQDAKNYAPLVVRNIAVPAAQYGPTAFMILFIVGMLMQSFGLMVLGLICFGGLVFFQLVNLPVEFDASNRAKAVLTELQIVDGEGAVAVRNVLNAAGWTYVAGTLQSVLTFAYYAFRIFGGNRN